MKTKIVNTLLLLAIIIPLPSSCSKTKTTDLRVKFTNTTGYKLKGLKIDGQRIGNLDINQTTNFIFFEHITFDGNTPIMTAEARINGQKTDDAGAVDCATMWKDIYEGTYYMDVILLQSDNKNKLGLKKK